LFFTTHDDLRQIVPLTHVKRLEFDKDFNTVLELKEKYSKTLSKDKK
jgi:hypothetical protein